MPLDTSTYSLALLRLDGRRWNELRRLTAQISTQAAADGSSYLEMGNTKVICTVTGPSEAKGTGGNRSGGDKADVQVVINIAGFSGVDRKRRGRGDKYVWRDPFDARRLADGGKMLIVATKWQEDTGNANHNRERLLAVALHAPLPSQHDPPLSAYPLPRRLAPRRTAQCLNTCTHRRRNTYARLYLRMYGWFYLELF